VMIFEEHTASIIPALSSWGPFSTPCWLLKSLPSLDCYTQVISSLFQMSS
jgi:hypothetical protein